MRPYHCITRHNPPDTYGDCLRACVATILEMEPAEIPNFATGEGGMIERLTEWLQPQGYSAFVTMYPAVPLDELLEHIGSNNPEGVYILIGATESGENHTVVCKGDHIAWNPAWAGGKIIGPDVNDQGWPIVVLGKV